MRINRFAMLALALWTAAATAQYAFNPPDWVEAKAPAPPTFSADQLIPIDMPHYVTVAVGIAVMLQAGNVLNAMNMGTGC